MSLDLNRAAPARPRLSHLARTSLLIGFFFAIDKGLGLLRQVIIGRQFGVSSDLDAFNVANNLPDLLFAMISGGALAIAFIPVLSESLEREGRQAAWDLFSRVANLAFLVTGLAAVVIAIFAGPLVRAELGVAPGFTPELQSLVADLMRLNLVATLLFSLSGLVIAGLQANKHFLLPAVAPVVYDLGQIFGALVLAPSQGLRLAGITLPAAGLGVHGLVYGVILGAGLHFAVQIPGLIRYRFHWAPRLGWNHPGVRKVMAMLGPRILTMGAFQLMFVVQDNLASRLDVGSVTALAYGWLIMQVPETLLATALGTALLPTLSEQFAHGDDSAFQTTLARAARLLLALTVPAAVVLMIPLGPLVQSAFGFDARGTGLVVWAARAYLLGLTGHSLLEVCARGFYARHNARTPLLAALARTALFVALAVVLFRKLGFVGIGLSNSLAFTLEAALLIVLLSRRFRLLPELIKPALRTGLGAASGGLVAYAVMRLLAASPLAAGVLAVLAGVLATVPFLWPELRQAARL
jgi:putative peptidoglycan lipid II flippase